MEHAERVPDRRLLHQWGDLRVGDEVRVPGPPSFTRSDLMVVLELHVVDALGPDREEVMAVVRDTDGTLHTTPARRLERH